MNSNNKIVQLWSSKIFNIEAIKTQSQLTSFTADVNRHEYMKKSIPTLYHSHL